VTRVQSFAPILGKHPRILILGSMPGIASLEAVQYYAHPRNIFWPIMADLFSIDAETDYARRIAQISEAPVILWDTLKRCERSGSLDASIKRDTVEVNDIPGLLSEFPGIRAVACNGATSANYFRKLVMPQISAEIEIEMLPMPSTSPANAGMTFAQKLAAWRRLLAYID
jgi:TDG/mug DNA glycosylase family protein